MPKLKIVFFETFGRNKKYLKSKISKDFNLYFVDEPLGEENLALALNADIIGVFVCSKVSSAIIDKLPQLKLIVTMSTGFDHIDVAYANKKNITVCNVPTYGENTVAEHAFALLLSISRKIFESNLTLKSGGFYSEALMGFDLKGKVIGILGCGNIGRHLAKMAYGFDMKILAYDLYPDREFALKYNVTYVKSIQTILENSDIISLHLPLNKETHHIINKTSISRMKNGVIIINTARGALIDSLSLYEALLTGKVRGAGIDVFEEENYIKEEVEILLDNAEITYDLKTVLIVKKIINHPNVIATPHNAFNSNEAVKRIMDTTIKNIVGFKKGSLANTITLNS